MSDSRILEEPLTKEEVVARLKEYCLNNSGLPSAAEILGLTNEEVNAIKPKAKNEKQSVVIAQTINELLPPGVKALTNYMIRYSENKPLAVVYPESLVSATVLGKLFLEVLEPVFLNSIPTVIVFSDSPESGLWNISTADSIQIIVLPMYRTLDSNLTLEDSRFPAVGESSGPARWRKVKDGNALVGWKRGGVFASRINPLIKSNQFGSRLTSSSSERRRVAMASIFKVLTDTSVSILDLKRSADKWRDIFSFTETLLNTARQENKEIYNRIDELKNNLVKANRSVKEAERKMKQAEKEFKEAKTNLEETERQNGFIDALEKSVANYVVRTLEDEEEQQHSFLNLPQVRNVFEDNNSLWVQTHPLIIDCGAAGKKRIDDLRVNINLNGNSLPKVSANHPLSVNGEINWQNSALPLTEKISSGEWTAALSIVLGQLSAPIQVKEENLQTWIAENPNLADVPEESRVGYQIPSRA